ncbi:hypothetical protein BGW80DRAFT_1468266 [Lactifluus volemus]|nr:hypothetical protein BGW80DRAFT_1468266 [Lactifluus volemus]
MNPQRLRWSIVQHLELDYAERSLRSNRSSRQTHHLRTLVVAFLAKDVRRSLLTKLQGRGNICAEQDQAPIDTLLKSVSTFSGASASKITRDILVFLPSFNSGRPTGCGNELFQAFLAQAMSLLKEDLAPRRIPASQERASNATRRVESDELVSMRCRVVDALAINLPARWSETACYSPPPLISILCDAGFHSNSPVRCAGVAAVRIALANVSAVVYPPSPPTVHASCKTKSVAAQFQIHLVADVILNKRKAEEEDSKCTARTGGSAEATYQRTRCTTTTSAQGLLFAFCGLGATQSIGVELKVLTGAPSSILGCFKADIHLEGPPSFR